MWQLDCVHGWSRYQKRGMAHGSAPHSDSQFENPADPTMTDWMDFLMY